MPGIPGRRLGWCNWLVKLLLFAALARKGENRLVRPELPTVTVTFLFTDIEGSTRLIDFLGEDGYVEALAEHRRLLRAAFSACGGVEVDTQGDAFLYAFSDPMNAVAAATQGHERSALDRSRCG